LVNDVDVDVDVDVVDDDDDDDVDDDVDDDDEDEDDDVEADASDADADVDLRIDSSESIPSSSSSSTRSSPNSSNRSANECAASVSFAAEDTSVEFNVNGVAVLEDTEPVADVPEDVADDCDVGTIASEGTKERNVKEIMIKALPICNSIERIIILLCRCR